MNIVLYFYLKHIQKVILDAAVKAYDFIGYQCCKNRTSGITTYFKEDWILFVY